jgi:ABC-type transport system involved in multi-copper enzyme maturation permease subunit
VTTIAAFALREALRRRVFTVVAVLTVACGGLYALGVWQAFKIVDDFGSGFAGVDPKAVTGATLFGLALFGTLFLGAILAVFLTLGAVGGDAERGLLQPVLVRPISRRTLLTARFLAAAGVCAAYVLLVYLVAMLITGAIGGWWPDRIVRPALEMMAAVAVLAALSLAGSVFLAATANGIAVFMCFGAGLVSGLLGQVGDALGSHTLQDVATTASWLLPFEALYQSALSDITAETVGFTRLAIDLGPLGGAHEAGPGLWLYCVVYMAAVGAVATAAFNRRDL